MSVVKERMVGPSVAYFVQKGSHCCFFRSGSTARMRTLPSFWRVVMMAAYSATFAHGDFVNANRTQIVNLLPVHLGSIWRLSAPTTAS